MRKITLTILILSIFISSCNVGGMWKDENIDPTIKAEIHNLNNEIIDGFVENNAEKVFAICSKKLLEKGKNDLSYLMQQVRASFIKEDFRILNEFYQQNSSEDVLTHVMTGMSGDHDYLINYKALNKEMYVTVGYFENDLSETCLTIIYGKYGNEWKVNIIRVGTLTIMKKNAFDWYQSAKSNYEKGYLVDAANDLFLINQVLQPAGQFWQYQKQLEIQEFGEKIMTDINNSFTFPIMVESIETKPEIFRIFPQGMEKGYFPMILYTSKIAISDTVKLSAECDAIHSEIGKLFNGLDKDKEYIFYRAFEKIPVGNEFVENYGFIKEY